MAREVGGIGPRLHSGAECQLGGDRFVLHPRGGDPASGGRVTVEIENYLAVLSQARRRTYQDQSLFDPGDASAARIRASANGVQGAAVGGGGGGNAQPYNPYEQER